MKHENCKLCQHPKKKGELERRIEDILKEYEKKDDLSDLERKSRDLLRDILEIF